MSGYNTELRKLDQLFFSICLVYQPLHFWLDGGELTTESNLKMATGSVQNFIM